MTHHVLISDSKSTTVDHDLQTEVLEGYDATTTSVVTRTEAELLPELDGVDGLIVDAGVPVTGRILATESLRVVGRAGIGVDNVDLEAAADHGVTVVHHPTYSIDEVATHALSLLLAGIRRLPRYDRSTRSGEWDWTKVRRSGDSRGRPSGSWGSEKYPDASRRWSRASAVSCSPTTPTFPRTSFGRTTSSPSGSRTCCPPLTRSPSTRR